MIQKPVKRNACRVGLTLGILIAAHLSAGTVKATEATMSGTATDAPKKKGLFSKAKENVANATNAARRAVCTNTLISAANFRSATLNDCVANYPEDMKKLQDDLRAKQAVKKKSYHNGDMEHHQKGKGAWEYSSEMGSLRTGILRLRDQIQAIEEAANNAIVDLNAKVNDPKYQKNYSSFQEQKERIEKSFPLNDSKEREEEKIEFNSGIRVFYSPNKQKLEESIERRKQMGQPKEVAAKVKTDVSNGPRRAVCTNTLIYMANFRSATLNNCVADYPEDMKNLWEDLRKKQTKKNNKYKELDESPLFSDGDDIHSVRSEISTLKNQIEAIEEAANIAIIDLDGKMISPKYQKSYSSLQARKERIEKAFPVDLNRDPKGQKLEDSIIRRGLINSPEYIKKLQDDLRKEQESKRDDYKKLNDLNSMQGNVDRNLRSMQWRAAEIGQLRDRIQAIEEAANNAIVDLEEKLKDPTYSASRLSLQAKKEKIEGAFPLKDLNGKREEEEIVGPGKNKPKLEESIKRRSEMEKSKN